MLGRIVLGLVALVSPLERGVGSPVATPHFASTSTLSVEQRRWAIEYARNALAEQCESQADLPWCGKVSENHRALDPQTIANLSTLARQNFKYQIDVVDSWRSHAGSALMGKEWIGDCDDLASTTLALMAQRGQPLDQMWLILVNHRSDGVFDHLVAMVRDSNGRYWIVGDTSAANFYPVEKLTYRVVALTEMASKNVWVDPGLLRPTPLISR